MRAAMGLSPVLLLVLAVSPGAAVRGQSTVDQLTLSAAIERALEHFPSLSVAEASQRAAAAGVEEAAAARLPAASLSSRGIHYREPAPVTPFHGFSLEALPEFDEDLVQSELALRYSLYAGGARAARLGRAEARAAGAEAAVAAARDEIVARTVATYLRTLGVAEVLAAHDHRMAAFEEERSRVEQRLSVGRAARVELQRIEAKLAAAEAERVGLETVLGTAEQDLARLLGAAPGSVTADRLVAVELAVEPMSRQALVEQALEASPAIRQARQEIVAAEYAIEVARSARRPGLSLEGRYQELGSGELEFASEWDVALRLGWTLFDGGATGAAIRRAEAEREAAEERLRLLESELQGELDRALADVARTAARADSLELAAASFAEVARIEKLRLETGVGVQADYLDTEAEWLEARAALTEARFGRSVAEVEVARITGALDPEWVAQHLVESTP